MSATDKLHCVWTKETDENLKLMQKILAAGSAAGADTSFWSKLADNKELFKQLIAIVNASDTNIVSEQRARDIMGTNFLGVESAVQHLNVVFSVNDLCALAVIPFSEEELESVKDTHILIAIPTISLNDIHKAACDLFYVKPNFIWFEKEDFAVQNGQAGWYLIRKNTIPHSVGKRWSEQQELLTENEETPSARILVYTIILYYMATGSRLFGHDFVYTNDKDSDDLRVYVGNFDFAGLFVGDFWHGHHAMDVGLASSLKPKPDL